MQQTIDPTQQRNSALTNPSPLTTDWDVWWLVLVFT